MPVRALTVQRDDGKAEVERIVYRRKQGISLAGRSFGEFEVSSNRSSPPKIVKSHYANGRRYLWAVVATPMHPHLCNNVLRPAGLAFRKSHAYRKSQAVFMQALLLNITPLLMFPIVLARESLRWYPWVK